MDSGDGETSTIRGHLSGLYKSWLCIRKPFFEEKVFRDGYVREPQWSQRGNVTVTHWMPLPEPPKEENNV